MNAPDSFTLAQFGATSFMNAMAADASDLGYPPGQWPARFEIAGEEFKDAQPVKVGGELVACDYYSSKGYMARISND